MNPPVSRWLNRRQFIGLTATGAAGTIVLGPRLLRGDEAGPYAQAVPARKGLADDWMVPLVAIAPGSSPDAGVLRR